jgi:hypothetical protein
MADGEESALPVPKTRKGATRNAGAGSAGRLAAVSLFPLAEAALLEQRESSEVKLRHKKAEKHSPTATNAFLLEMSENRAISPLDVEPAVLDRVMGNISSTIGPIVAAFEGIVHGGDKVYQFIVKSNLEADNYQT